MDFNSLEPVKTAVFYHLKHPVTFNPMYVEGEDGQPDKDEPIGVDLLGADSDEYEKRQLFLTEERLQKMESNLENKGKLGGVINTSAVEQDRLNLETIAACIKGWRNVKVDGEIVPYTHDNAIKLLRRFKWMREQIDKAIADRSLFMRALPRH